jgi:hypothetical protein
MRFFGMSADSYWKTFVSASSVVAKAIVGPDRTATATKIYSNVFFIGDSLLQVQ